MKMTEKLKHPAKAKGASKAGITIHLDLLDGETEPVDITLFFKRPKAKGDDPPPIDENSLTASGQLVFKFGERGYIEIFGENTKVMDDVLPEHWGEI
jgi:hypothetical protein